MARKKKSQTDRPAAPEGATEGIPDPADARGTPATEAAGTGEGRETGPDATGTAQTPAPGMTPEDTPAPDTQPQPEQATESDDPAPDATGDAGQAAPEDHAAEGTAQDDTPQDDTAPQGDTAPQDESAPQDDTAPQDESAPQDDTAPQDAPTPPAGEDAAPSSAEPNREPAPVMRTEQVTVRKGGFWSMLLGGIAAAAIGVAAAPYIHPHLPVGQTPVPAPAEDGNDDLAARLDEQAERISDLGARIDGLPAPVDPSGEIEGLSETVTSLTERVANLEVRLSNLADRPAPEAPDTGETDAALDALRDSLAAQSAEIETLRATLHAEEEAARDSARATLQRAALTRVMTALDTGEDFSAALTDLRDTGAEVPEALSGPAETGVPTRARLVEGFPEAARAALTAARATEADGGASVGDFLRAQLGVRSLAPREGDDADAILSRAEAALADGRLGDALAEIETLPEGARAAMSGWAAEAATRRDALTAAEALSAELN